MCVRQIEQFVSVFCLWYTNHWFDYFQKVVSSKLREHCTQNANLHQPHIPNFDWDRI